MNEFKSIKRLAVKVGTSTLTYPSGKLNIRRLMKLCTVLADLSNSGLDIVLITSGAIGVGSGKLGLEKKPGDVRGRQAAASVGQCELMFMYDKFFGEYGIKIGQLLVTKGDFEDKVRCENLKNTFDCLFEFGALPVVNENDCVATEEIVYGDNDSLGAVVAKLTNCEGMIILTDIDGLFDANPMDDSEAKLIPIVDEITEEILALCGGSGTELGTGGMATKVQAAKIAADAGIPTVVMNGSSPDDIYKVLEGRQCGTLFRAKK